MYKERLNSSPGNFVETRETCPFCHLDRETIVENEHALAFLDLFPVSAGHSLVIPKIHIESVFELPSPIYVACFTLVRDLKNILQKKHNPDGFNIVRNSCVANRDARSHSCHAALPG